MEYIIVGLILFIQPNIFKSILGEDRILDGVYEQNKENLSFSNILSNKNDLHKGPIGGENKDILKDLKIALEQVKKGVEKRAEHIVNITEKNERRYFYDEASELVNNFNKLKTKSDKTIDYHSIFGKKSKTKSDKNRKISKLEVNKIHTDKDGGNLAFEKVSFIDTNTQSGEENSQHKSGSTLHSGQNSDEILVNISQHKELHKDVKSQDRVDKSQDKDVKRLDKDSSYSTDFVLYSSQENNKRKFYPSKKIDRQKSIYLKELESSLLFTSQSAKIPANRTPYNIHTLLDIYKNDLLEKYFNKTLPDREIIVKINDAQIESQESGDKNKSGGLEPSHGKLLGPEGIEGVADMKDISEKDQLETYSQFAERVSAEKKNGASGSSSHSSNGQAIKGPKVKSKDYASPDCGAKLLAANPESSHSHKIIHSNKDEYMLNKCADKIWAVVELCESIKPQKFAIANFELFSNLPKEIQLSGSHRYPTRDWVTLGVYTAEEGNREIQSFEVKNEEFFKYIRIEVLSHYGTEFYCPISLFRIYGLSEFEVIEQMEETEEIVTEEDTDSSETENVEIKNREKPGMIPNVLKSMLSGVLDVIKRGSRSSNRNNEPEEFNIYTRSCFSLQWNYAIPKDSCYLSDSLNYILACFSNEYKKLILNPFIALTARDDFFCQTLANISCSSPDNNDSLIYDTICNNSYACVMLSPKHILAMCYIQNASIINRLKVCGGNASNYSVPDNYSIELKDKVIDSNNSILSSDIEVNKSVSDKFSTEVNEQNLNTFGEAQNSSLPQKSENTDLKLESKEKKANIDNYLKIRNKTFKKKEEYFNKKIPHAKNVSNTSLEESEKHQNHIIEDEKQEVDTPKNVSLSTEGDSAVNQQGSPSIATTPSPPVVENRGGVSSSNKESIVVRLSNKIKVLEQNMSISNQYLEELSRRYKRQMEEMQHQFNITIKALNKTSQTAFERDLYHQKHIEALESQLERLTNIVDKMTKEKDNFLSTVIEQHMILLAIEIGVLFLAFIFCIGRNNKARETTPPFVNVNGHIAKSDSVITNHIDHKCRKKERTQLDISNLSRRRSVDSRIRAAVNKTKVRRLSGEMDNISGCYEHLMVDGREANHFEKKKKKRKSSLKRSLSHRSLHERKQQSSKLSPTTSRKESKKQDQIRRSSAAGVLFSHEAKMEEPTGSAVQEIFSANSEEGWSTVRSGKFNKKKYEKAIDENLPENNNRDSYSSDFITFEKPRMGAKSISCFASSPNNPFAPINHLTSRKSYPCLTTENINNTEETSFMSNKNNSARNGNASNYPFNQSDSSQPINWPSTSSQPPHPPVFAASGVGINSSYPTQNGLLCPENPAKYEKKKKKKKHIQLNYQSPFS